MTTRRLLAFVGVAALVVGFVSATFIAVSEPLSLGDFGAIWGLKARAIDRSGTLSAVFRVDPDGSFSHPEYPLAWPLLLAAFGRFTGGWDELHLTLLRPLLLALAALLAARLTRGSIGARLLAAAGVTLLPYFHDLLFVGYAEGLLLVFVLLALREWDDLEKSAFALARFSLFLVLAASTKYEGLLVALFAVAGLALSRRFRAAWVAGGAVAVGVLPWMLFRAFAGPPRALVDFSLASFHPGKVLVAVSTIVTVGSASSRVALLLAALGLTLSPATLRRRRGLILAAAVYTLLFVLSYGFSRLDPVWHVNNSFDRLLLIPVAVLVPVLAEAAEEAFSREAVPAESAPA